MRKTELTKEQRDQIINALENHPQIKDSILSILAVASEPLDQGKIRPADQIEEELIEEIRKLGNKTLCSWAEQVEEALTQEQKKTVQGVQQREKKL